MLTATLVLADATLPEATTGEEYSYDFSSLLPGVSGLAWSAGAGVPSGLALYPNGMLSGVPTEPGGGSFAVLATKTGASGQKVYTIIVNGNSLDVVQLVAGTSHTCAVTPEGSAKCWGWNANGQLGDGTTTDRLTPTEVTGLSSGVSSISLGMGHTCAVTTAGAALCWGSNGMGQLGDGTTTAKYVPTAVSGLTSGVAAISASGGNFTCALTTGGAAKCWGNNGYGQLGDNTVNSRTVPTNVSGLSSGVASIGTGSGHTCAVTTAGTAKCWGWGGYGQVGDGTSTNRRVPTNVSGLSSGVTAISAGGHFSCAVTSGALTCWGRNIEGQLGDGTTTNRLVPTSVSGLSSGVATTDLGQYHSCAVTTAGAAKCWGQNGSGRIGDGTTTNALAPTDVSGLSSGVTSITAGAEHTCAISAAGTKCWGRGAAGRLGSGNTTDQLVPGYVIQ